MKCKQRNLAKWQKIFNKLEEEAQVKAQDNLHSLHTFANAAMGVDAVCVLGEVTADGQTYDSWVETAKGSGEYGCDTGKYRLCFRNVDGKYKREVVYYENDQWYGADGQPISDWTGIDTSTDDWSSEWSHYDVAKDVFANTPAEGDWYVFGRDEYRYAKADEVWHPDWDKQEIPAIQIRTFRNPDNNKTVIMAKTPPVKTDLSAERHPVVAVFFTTTAPGGMVQPTNKNFRWGAWANAQSTAGSLMSLWCSYNGADEEE